MEEIRAARIANSNVITPWTHLKWCRVSVEDSLDGDVIMAEQTGFPALTATTGLCEARSKAKVVDGQKMVRSIASSLRAP